MRSIKLCNRSPSLSPPLKQKSGNDSVTVFVRSFRHLSVVCMDSWRGGPPMPMIARGSNWWVRGLSAGDGYFALSAAEIFTQPKRRPSLRPWSRKCSWSARVSQRPAAQYFAWRSGYRDLRVYKSQFTARSRRRRPRGPRQGAGDRSQVSGQASRDCLAAPGAGPASQKSGGLPL